MSRQRKSRKFTYSLLSPGTLLFHLLLIPSPFPQSHLQLALTCCGLPFFFFFFLLFLPQMCLADKTWAVRNDQEMKLPRKGRGICMEMHFPLSHCLHQRGSPPLSRRRAGNSQSAGNIWLLHGFISTLGKGKPASPEMDFYWFPKGQALVEKLNQHHMGSLHYLFLNFRVLGAVTRGCAVQSRMRSRQGLSRWLHTDTGQV